MAMLQEWDKSKMEQLDEKHHVNPFSLFPKLMHTRIKNAKRTVDPMET